MCFDIEKLKEYFIELSWVLSKAELPKKSGRQQAKFGFFDLEGRLITWKWLEWVHRASKISGVWAGVGKAVAVWDDPENDLFRDECKQAIPLSGSIFWTKIAIFNLGKHNKI